jgi:hypothetical protein
MGKLVLRIHVRPDSAISRGRARWCAEPQRRRRTPVDPGSQVVRDAIAGRRRSVWWALIVLCANCVLAVVLFWTAWAHPASWWIGDGRDPNILVWDLAWTPHNLGLPHPHPLVSDFIMYPFGVNLMWTVSMVFPALVLWPVTALFGPVVAFNLLATIALALSSWLAYLVVRRYVWNESMAALAGMVYGFSPYMVLQSLGHTHVTIAVLPPLVWLLLDELLVRRRWHPALVGVLLGTAGAAQLLTSTEILATTALVAGIGIGLLALLHRSQVESMLPRAALGMQVAVLSFLVLAAYPLKVLAFGPQRVVGTIEPPNVFVADLLSFVTPPGYRFPGAIDVLGIVAKFTGNGVETGGAYLGVPGLVVLALALIIGWRSEVVRFAGLLSACVMVLALGPTLHVAGHVTELPLPWALVQVLPLMGGALPARLMLFAWLGVAVVLGVVGGRLISSGWRSAGAAIAAAAFFLIPIFPTPPLLTTPVTAPTFFSSHGEVTHIPQGSVALVTPFSNQESSTAMYWQVSSDFRFRMPEGEAFVPGPSLSPPPSSLQQDLVALDAGTYPAQPPADERAPALANLRQWNVDTIVVGPSPGQSRIVAFFTRVLGRRPERTGGVSVWWNVRSTVDGHD